MSDDAFIEGRLQALGLNAPRLTPTMIDACIKEVYYHRVPNTTMTLCVLTLRNGFQVTGESAAASPENFDEQIGKDIALRNAREKIWALEGYRLKQMLHATQWKADFSSPERIVETAAMLAHEVNRVWCAMNGDYSQPAWVDAPDWQRGSARQGIHFHWQNPNAGDDASHNNWMAQKLNDGWVYGEKKDPANKTHPCIRPFEELPLDQRLKDALFRSVAHAFIPLLGSPVVHSGE